MAAQKKEDCDNKTALDKAFDEAIASLEYKTCFYASKEKAVVSAWIAKLKSSNTSLDEMRLRNDIVKYLLDLANAKAVSPAPFNEAPKSGTITELAKSFPPSIPIVCKTDATRNYLLEMFDNSPDNGNFLASQPVPKSGTFCYFILRKVRN